MSTFRSRFPYRSLSLAAALVCSACGDDDSSDDAAAGSGGRSAAGSGNAGTGGRTAAGSGGGAGASAGKTGGDDDGAEPDAGVDDSAAAGAPAGGAGGAGGSSALYALSVVVYDPEWNSTVSVHLSHSLDLGSELDSSQDRTFSGVVNSAAVGQRLLISSGDMPKITEYEISEDLAWTEGKSVSFLDYPLSDNANFYYQYLVDDHTAYMPFDVTSRVLWDPTTMTLGETLRDSSVPATKDGLTAHDGGNRAAVRFTGPVRQPIYYTDKDYFAFSQDTLLAIYDEKTHAEKAVVSLPCPAVTTATVDEKGYTYYSSWEFQGTRALFGEGPKPCVARLKPDLTVDSEWTTDLRDITDGRYVNNLRYLGKGKAVANVLHHEVLEADWKGGYNADVATTIAKDGEHWRVWLFDLDKHTGKPVEGLDLPVNGHSSLEQVDGRSFLFAVYENWARSRIYELSDDGKATKRVDLKGVAAKWIRVR